MIVRDANRDDIPSILRMGKEFYDSTYFRQIAEFDEYSVMETVNMVLEHGVLKLAEEDGVAYGMCGFVIFPYSWNFSVIAANEVFWYVSKDFRSKGISKKLKLESIQACIDKGAKPINMGLLESSPEQARAMYEADGFILKEYLFVKVV